MKKTCIYILLSITLLACNRDDSVLNDYELFGRLQSGNGMWQVVNVTTHNNSEKTPTENDITPENSFFHFYLKTSQIAGVLVDINHATRYTNGEVSKSSDIEAEPLRVVFTNGQVLGGEVWSVSINKPNTQQWVNVAGSTTTTMLLERCKCDLPTSKTTEQGG